MVGIYKFTNRITGEAYIGKSRNIEKRYKAHKKRWDPNRPSFENTYFHKEMAKYGWDAFAFEVLEECKPEELNDKEIYYINLHNTLYPNGYNIEAGGIHSPHPFKITWDEVFRIQQELKDGTLYQAQIAKKYGISTSEVSMINMGKIWIVDGEKYPLRSPKPLPKKPIPVCKVCGKPVTLYGGIKYCKKCWNEEIRRFIPEKSVLKELLSQKSQKEVSEMYGVSRNTVLAWQRRYGINNKGKDIII